jgi:hypothetical protein
MQSPQGTPVIGLRQASKGSWGVLGLLRLWRFTRAKPVADEGAFVVGAHAKQLHDPQQLRQFNVPVLEEIRRMGFAGDILPESFIAVF